MAAEAWQRGILVVKRRRRKKNHLTLICFSFQINSGPSSSSFGDNFYADDDGTTLLGQILNSTRILRLDLNALDARLTTVGKNLASQVQEESDKTEQNRVSFYFRDFIASSLWPLSPKFALLYFLSQADVNSLQQLVKVLNQGLKSAEKRCEELENGGAISEKSNSGVKRPIVQVGSTIANEKSKEVKNDLNAENK